MKGATKEQVTEKSKKIDAEVGVLKCFRALMKSDIKSTDIAFGEITFAELAASLESAVNFIDYARFELGEGFGVDKAHSDKNFDDPGHS